MTDQKVPVEQSGEPVAAPEIIEDKKSVITYETHRKLLDEKKRVQSQLDILLKEKQESQEADARKRGDLESILKARDEELAKERSQRQELSDRITNGRKMNSVLEALGGNVDQKWYELINVSDVAINPETGDIDQMTVAKVAESLKTKWPEMIKRQGVLPPNAPQGNGAGTISHDDWKKLPLKEMQKWKQNQII